MKGNNTGRRTPSSRRRKGADSIPEPTAGTDGGVRLPSIPSAPAADPTIDRSRDAAEAISAISNIDDIPAVLDAVSRTTGMRYVVIAKVTAGSWTACAVLDKLDFGLAVGGELEVATTLCSEVRDKREPIVIDHASKDPVFCNHPTPKKYGIESYIAVPIVRKDGEIFGTLCAIDSRPADLSSDLIVQSLELYAELIAAKLDAQEDIRMIASSEQRYRAFIENSTEGIWRFALERPMPVSLSTDEQIEWAFKYGFLAECNDSFAKQYGHSSTDRIIGARLTDLLVADDPKNIAFLKAFLESGYRLIDAESHEKDAAGNDLYFLNSFVGTVENGYLLGAWGTQRDITEQKSVRTILDRYRLLSLQARDIILFLEPGSGRIIEANQAAVQAYGYDHDTLLTMNIADLRAPETLGVLAEQYRSANDQGLRFETVHRRKDGTRFPVEVSAIGSDVGDERLIVSIIRDISERKAAEETLLQNQAILSLAMHSSQMGAWSRDLKTNTVWWSEQLEAIFGLPKGAFTATENAFYNLVHEEDRDDVFVEVERAIAERRSYSIEFRFHHADGGIRWMEGRGEAVYSKTGEPVRLYGVGIDITERKRTEAMIRRQARIINLSSEPMIIWDRSSGVIEWNAGAERLYGYTAEEAVGLDTHELLKTVYTEPLAEMYEKLDSSGEWTGELQHTTKSGNYLIVESRQQVIDIDGRRLILETNRDITDRKIAESMLAQSEAEFRNLFELSTVGTAQADPAGRFVRVNQRMCEITGYSEDELLQKTIGAITHPDDLEQDRTVLGPVLRGEADRWDVEKRYVRPDGEIVWVHVTGRLVRDKNGNPYRTVAGILDITENKRAEEQLRSTAERLNLALTASGLGDWSWDAGTDVVTFSERAAEIFGIPAGPHMTWTEMQGLLHEEDREYARTEVERSVASGGRYEVEYRVNRPAAGDTVWVSAIGRARFDESGKLLGMFGVVQDITERKRLQNAVLESEERFRGLMEQAPFSIQLFDPSGRPTRTNRAWEQLWGVTLDQIPEYNILQDPQLEVKGIADHIRRAFAGEVVELPAIQYDPNETIPDRTKYSDPRRWVAAVAYPLRDTDGRISQVALVHQDITERVAAEEALRKSEERLDLAVRAHGVGIFDWYIQTGEVVWTEQAERIFGLEPGTFGGNIKDWGERVLPEDLGPMNALMSEAMARGDEHLDFSFRIKRPSGEIRHIEGSARFLYTADGTPERMVGTNVDVTERKKAEDAIRESEARFRHVADSAPVMIWVSDTKNKGIWYNKPWLDFTGRPLDAELGDGWADLIHPDDVGRCLRTCKSAFAAREPFSVEFRVRRHDGEYRWLLDSGVPRFTASGEFLGYIGSAIDVHERRQAEGRLGLLAEISELIRNESDPSVVLYKVSEAVGEFLEVRRCLFNEIDLDNDREIVHQDYCRGVASVAGVHKISDYSSVTSAEMKSGRTVVNHDSKSDPRTAKDYERVYQVAGERSYIAVPLLRNGRWTASLWISDDVPRNWDRNDVSLLETVAERTWTAIEKLRIDAALRESEERFSKAFNSSPLVLAISSLEDGRLVEVNQTFVDITGYSREEAIGKSTIELGLWKRVSDREEEMEQVRRTGKVRNVEYEFVVRDGSSIIGLLSAEKIEIGGESFALTVIQDITERKRAEEQIRYQLNLTQTITDNTQSCLWLMDREGRATFVNHATEQISGYKPEELIGEIIHEKVHHSRPDGTALSINECPLTQTLRVHTPLVGHEDYFIHKDGHFYPVRCNARPIVEAGEFKGTVLEVQDITEEKRAQDALVKAERKAAEEYLELLERIVPLAETVGTAQDLDTIYRSLRDFINASMECSGFFVSFFEPEQSLRIPAYVWGEGEEIDISNLPPMPIQRGGGPNSQAIFEKRAVITNNYWDQQKNRPHVVLNENGLDPLSSLVVPMMLRGEVIGTLEVQAHRDHAFQSEHAVAVEMAANLAAVAIRNVRLIETEAHARADAEKANRMKDEFLSVLSHELRTPLNAMLGWIRLLRGGGLDDQRSAKALEIIERNTRQQSSLIEDLLDVSRIISGKMRVEKELLDLNNPVLTAAETIRPLAAAKDVIFLFEGDEEPLFMRGDAVRLQQVVTNLLQNAVKFTPAGGVVTLSKRRVGLTAEIVVSDTGLGISKEFLPHIFDRFSQADLSTKRSNTGLGLGLTIVSNIVELHGGQISADSNGPDTGSTFRVRLPLASELYNVESSSRPAESLPSGAVNGLEIIVVDDDEESLLPIRILLEREGANVVCSVSPQEALEMLASKEFDILISDVGMPGLDGYELIAAVRSDESSPNRRTKAIALTAYASADDRIKLLKAGFDEHVTKPLEFDELIAVITKLNGPQLSN